MGARLRYVLAVTNHRQYTRDRPAGLNPAFSHHLYPGVREDDKRTVVTCAVI